MQKKKIVKMILSVFIPVLLVIFGLVFYNWNHNMNKNNLIRKYRVDNTKEVYILGTIDKKHFNKINNYSMANVINAISNINPDVVLLQARDDHHKTYGIVDGKIDACVAYGYCFESQIPAKFYDWWLIDNIYPGDKTTNLKADNMFIKISRYMDNIKPGSKVLIIANIDEYYELIARCEIGGFKRHPIEDKDAIFNGDSGKFKFPAVVSKIWRDRTYFYAYSFPAELKLVKGLNPEILDKYQNADHDKFYQSEIKYCKYLNNDILFK